MADRREGCGAITLGWIIVGFLVLFTFWPSCCRRAEAAKDDRTDFIKGYDAGRSFLPANTLKGAKMRRGLQSMHELYGPWCLMYARYGYVSCLMRIWFESRGNPYSHTKDTLLLEAGLTSVSYATGKKLAAMGHGGSACGDPKWAIAASSWRNAEQRQQMFEGKIDDETGEPYGFWYPWLIEQWKENRIEAEYLMSICGSANCQKLRKAINYSGVLDDPKGKDGKIHVFWKLMDWLRDQVQSTITEILAGVKTSQWRFGFRWGRSSIHGWRVRAEFWPPNEDGSENYEWGDQPYYFPEVYVPGEGNQPAMPDSLKPMPKKRSDWRDGCVLYSTKAWHTIWDLPQPNDRWKTSGFKYRWDGKPIQVKKGERKYKTTAEWQAAFDVWFDEQQALGLLPTDEEFEWWSGEMERLGFTMVVTEEAWEKWVSKEAKKKGGKK